MMIDACNYDATVTSRVTHGVQAPGSLLRELREVLAPQMHVLERTKVLYTTRKGQTMRTMDADEERVVARLKEVVVSPCKDPDNAVHPSLTHSRRR